MSSPLYLIRHSVSTLSPALYSHQDLNVSACTLESSIDLAFYKPETVAVRSVQGLDDVRENSLTYRQLLDVIIEASKVITL